MPILSRYPVEYRSIAGEEGEEDLAVGATVVRLTLPSAITTSLYQSLYGRAQVQNRDADLIFKINGLDPVAEDPSSGQTLFRPATLEVIGVEMSNLRMVRATAVDSAVHVRYEELLG